MNLAINQATLMKTPMEKFLDAVAKAGFEGVELRRDETLFFLENHSISELRDLLENLNLKCITFNAIELFSLCPESEFKKILKYSQKLMEIGNKIGCDTIIAVPSFLEEYLEQKLIYDKTIARLKILTNLAEEYNFNLYFEPLGFKNNSVRKLNFALDIISDDSLPTIGLVIDTFHFFVGENSLEDLELIPKEKIRLIHVNDAIEKDLTKLQDSDRVFPIEGFFDLQSFFEILNKKGYNDWISLELFNESLWYEDPYKVAAKSFNSIKKLI